MLKSFVTITCLVLLLLCGSISNVSELSLALPSNVSAPALHSVPLKGTQDQSFIHITAGKIQDFNFSISGSSNAPKTSINPLLNSQEQPLPRISDLSVSLASQSGSVRILGNTHWNLQSIQAGSNVVLSTQVYASSALIGSPVFFTVAIQYIQNGQQVKTESFDIGAIVVGDIKLQINNIGIRYIGSTPNLVGNLLNEGNTPALFTNVEMLQQKQQSKVNNSLGSQTSDKGVVILPLSSDYLGSIPANTPVPFNIPLKITQQPTRINEQQNNINARINQIGAQSTSENVVQDSSVIPKKLPDPNLQSENRPILYPVALNITYSDDLKNDHQLIVNKTLGYNFELGQVQNAQNKLEYSTSDQNQNFPSQGGSFFTNGFIDAYWAANTSVCSANSNSSTLSVCSSTSSALPVPPQQEVGPGEGQSIFAVVLSNTEFTDINGIIGYLTLPPGFTSATSTGAGLINNNGLNENNANPPNVAQSKISGILSPSLQQPQTAIASFTNLVKSGQTYTLYFKVNIGKGVKVGDYLASLRIFYFKVPALEPGLYNSQSFRIPFSLPGKVILDASSKTTTLKPGLSNTASIEIRNKGTANANSVLVSITGISGNSIANNVVINQPGTISSSNNTTSPSNPSGQITTTSPTSSIPTVNLGARTFNIGTIPVNGTAEINPIIYPSESAGGTLQNLNLQISYTAANGNAKSLKLLSRTACFTDSS